MVLRYVRRRDAFSVNQAQAGDGFALPSYTWSRPSMPALHINPGVPAVSTFSRIFRKKSKSWGKASAMT
jgi:hypothetical protein